MRTTDQALLGVTGFDRIVIEVPLVAIDSYEMGNAINGIAYADTNDRVYLEVEDLHTGEHKRIKTFIVSYATDGSLRHGKITDKDCIKYSVRVKQVNNNLTGEIKTIALLDIVTGRTAFNTTHNIYNLHDPDIAKHLLESVKRDLALDGIYLGEVSSWELVTAEVNKTIETDLPMMEYAPVFEWLFEQLYRSEYYTETSHHKKKLKDRTESLTYKCKSRAETIKAYDKTAQVKDTMNIQIEENLIRFEITWNRESLKRKFNRDTADVTILSDMDLLNENFKITLNRIVEIARGSLEKEVNKILTQFTTTGKKEIKRLYSVNSSKLLDPVIFLKATQLYYARVKNKNLSTDIKSLKGRINPEICHRIKNLEYILAIFIEKDPELIKLNKTLRKFF